MSKTVLNTKTFNWDMRNQTALAYMKYHHPMWLVIIDCMDIDQQTNMSKNVR